jgi:hypothetical protein
VAEGAALPLITPQPMEVPNTTTTTTATITTITPIKQEMIAPQHQLLSVSPPKDTSQSNGDAIVADLTADSSQG